MQSDRRHGADDALWLGSVVIPRSHGMCELVLDSAEADRDQPRLVVVDKLQEHPKYKLLPSLPGTSELLFYVGVPIVLPNGIQVGAYCIFDDKPRPKLTDDEWTFLRDMAKTTMDHLEALRERAERKRKQELMVGLESFIDGLADLKSHSPNLERYQSLRTGDQDTKTRDGTIAISKSAPQEAPADSIPAATSHTAEAPAAVAAPTALWEMALPPGCQAMFMRAANIMRQSGDYDGVVFFYMFSASTRSRHSRELCQAPTTESASRRINTASLSGDLSTSTASSLESESLERIQSSTDRDEAPDPNAASLSSLCPVLSCSLSAQELAEPHEHEPNFARFTQRDMDRLLGKKPSGHTFIINAEGKLFSGDTSSSGSSVEEDNRNIVHTSQLSNTGSQSHEVPTGSRRHNLRIAQVRSLRKLSPEGRSFVCLPLWDYERQRWFAYAICWTRSPRRDLGMDGDLHFLRIFGNSIMNALAHIDTLASNRTKTAFVSSISHELRSPLHGMLGATSLLRDSTLDRFQHEMVDSISNSGRTLLDTVDHVMDFAKISSLTPHSNQRRRSRDRLKSRDRKRSVSEVAPVAFEDLALLVEEVLDTVHLGFTVQHDFLYPDEAVTASQAVQSPSALNRRGRVRVALQMPYRTNWRVRTVAGAWRRIIMNLFSNALKYTDTGLVTVCLQSLSEPGASNLAIALSVADTGRGISDNFMENRLFVPFSQEDSFSSGTGLGLSIVDQIVRALGGTTNVTSSLGVGTTVSVDITVPVADPDPAVPSTPMATDGTSSSSIDAVAMQLAGRRLCIVELPLGNAAVPESAKAERAERDFARHLADMLRSWFRADVSITDVYIHGTADFFLCLQPSFKTLDLIQGTSPVPPVIFIAHDSLEMAALRTDARISDGRSVVEMIAQPWGCPFLPLFLHLALTLQELAR